VTLEHFGNIRSADAKEDGTPVTVADRTAEELLREEIRSRFPDHGILGEEFGEEAGSVPVRWILDPIDGTRSFMRGVPLYAVLIGIEVEGKPVVGVAHFPALGETVAAGSGWGCRWTRVSGGEKPAHVSEVGDLGAACALTTDPATILSTSVGDGWRELCRRAGVVRGWGDAYGHILVATGRAEIMVDPVLSPWDAAALLPILSEAGGSFTDLDGKPTIHGGSGLSTNGRIHAAVLDLLWGRRPEPDVPPGAGT
jgi:histidinol phosphatase-like enzyme (inositol monophosphatase family)